MNYDDSDMKIVGADSETGKPPSDDAQATARLLEIEKNNGNLNRARRLGALLAEEVAAVEEEPDAGTDDGAGRTHRRILLAFVVDAVLEDLLPNNLLAQTAQTVYNDTLHDISPAFSNDLQESGAFSFYYLHVRDYRGSRSRKHWEDDDTVRRVGETFATLSGRTDDAAAAEDGASLYVRFIERIKTFIRQMAFV